MREPRFKICVPAYNALPWLERCLSSIEEQTYTNYELLVIDDASVDPRQREVIETICSRNGWGFRFNPVNVGPLVNVINGFRALNCVDSDVLLPIDGDDWLFSKDSLAYLAEVYKREAPLLTYGQAVHYSAGVLQAKAYRPWTVWLKRYRKRPFVLQHLRSFRYLLWRNILDRDLRDTKGNYFVTAGDAAFMYPMLEMAGSRFKFIKRVLYVYNDLNPISDIRIKRTSQDENAMLIRSRPPYKSLVLDQSELF